MKKKSAKLVFRCTPTGEMYDIIDGVQIRKQTKKIFYNKSKSKNNDKRNTI